jgi:hypothetical protein
MNCRDLPLMLFKISSPKGLPNYVATAAHPGTTRAQKAKLHIFIVLGTIEKIAVDLSAK